MTLRTRLLASVVLLLVTAVVVSNVVAVTSLRGYLLDQVDEQLVQSSRGPLDRALDRPLPGRGPGGPAGPTEFYIQQRDRSGDVVAETTPVFQTSDSAPLLSVQQIDDHIGELPFSVDAEGEEGLRHRVIIVADTNGGSISIAVPLNSIDATVSKLVDTTVLVTSAVIAVLVTVGYWTIRHELRPLDRMAATAASIAAGDLTGRVDHADDKTEVGRLGTSLNKMLGTIESSFRNQVRSELELRRFAADASHELRTPITSIRAYAELYRAGGLSDDEQLRRAMSRIESESRRMGDLVEELLLLARMDEGRTAEFESIDLARLLEDIVEDTRASAPERSILLDIGRPVRVDGDGAALTQALNNLLSNAVRHTPATAVVRVALRTEDAHAVVVVHDTGDGIPADALPHVFDRFYRVDVGRARATGGTGLGLAIVASVVDAHGGEVEVESTLGESSTFTLRLPLTPVAGQHPDRLDQQVEDRDTRED